MYFLFTLNKPILFAEKGHSFLNTTRRLVLQRLAQEYSGSGGGEGLDSATSKRSIYELKCMQLDMWSVTASVKIARWRRYIKYEFSTKFEFECIYVAFFYPLLGGALETC